MCVLVIYVYIHKRSIELNIHKKVTEKSFFKFSLVVIGGYFFGDHYFPLVFFSDALFSPYPFIICSFHYLTQYQKPENTY